MTRYLVTGASGLLGLNFSIQAAAENEVVGVVNEHPLRNPPFEMLIADLSVTGVAMDLLERAQPEVVIHCAALANVDLCESTPELAFRLNAQVPGEIAKACALNGVSMVHISTDAVFDGQRGGYVETDKPNPINEYARTKLAGEQAVADANPDALIARVNFYGWSLSGKRSLAEIFFNKLFAGQSMMGFTDVNFCPLQVNDLVDTLIEMSAKSLHGLYHVVSAQTLSKYEFGIALARQFGFDEGLIRPVSWKDAGLRAVRSPNLTLNVDRLQSALGHPLPLQSEGYERFYAQYRSGYPDRLHAMAEVHVE